MTYLIAADLPTKPAGERFREFLARPGILQLPGTHNGQSALQAKRTAILPIDSERLWVDVMALAGITDHGHPYTRRAFCPRS